MSVFESEGSVVAITKYVSLCRKASAGGGTIFLSGAAFSFIRMVGRYNREYKNIFFCGINCPA